MVCAISSNSRGAGQERYASLAGSRVRDAHFVIIPDSNSVLLWTNFLDRLHVDSELSLLPYLGASSPFSSEAAPAPPTPVAAELPVSEGVVKSHAATHSIEPSVNKLSLMRFNSQGTRLSKDHGNRCCRSSMRDPRGPAFLYCSSGRRCHKVIQSTNDDALPQQSKVHKVSRNIRLSKPRAMQSADVYDSRLDPSQACSRCIQSSPSHNKQRLYLAAHLRQS